MGLDQKYDFYGTNPWQIQPPHPLYQNGRTLPSKSLSAREGHYRLLSANLHPSPACVRACWPAELLRTSRRFGAKGGLKPSRNRPEMGPKHSEYAP